MPASSYMTDAVHPPIPQRSGIHYHSARFCAIFVVFGVGKVPCLDRKCAAPDARLFAYAIHKPTIGKAKPMHGTTILTVRHKGAVAMGGDGQVTVANSIIKGDAVKIRRLLDDRVLAGFAGATADAFALLERFEAKLKDHRSNIVRAAIELAKEWRTDRVLRRLEAMLAVADAKYTLLVTGNGDVVQPTDGVLGLGSGGNYAVAAARALLAHSNLGAAQIVRQALEIAAGIDVYTNNNIVVEEIPCEN